MTDRYVALDLEMTGVDLDSDEIIEIGAVKFTRDGVLDRFVTLVNPGRTLPRRIETLTGIRAAEVAEAPSLAAIQERLVAFVGDAAVVGQRVDWDLAFLAKHGLAASGPVLDTAELAEVLLPGLSDYGLHALATRLDVPFPVQHRALPDAEAAMAVFQRLCARAAELEPGVLQEIVLLTAASSWPLRHVFRSAAEEAVRRGRFTPESAAAFADPPAQAHQAGAALTPNARRRAVAGGEITRVLDAAAADTERFPLFEQRAEQERMAEAVTQSLDQDGRLVVEAATGTGKALDVETPIPTPSGWAHLGDLAIGDRVFDERGNPCRVIGAFDVLHDRPCYQVRFSDGSRLVADADHLWATSTRNARRRAAHRGIPSHHAELTAVTTAEIAATVWYGSRYRNHAVPVTKPLVLPDQALPIDPYVLGVWLGDGNSDTCQFTTADEEIAAQVCAAGYVVRRRNTARYQYIVNLESGPGKNRFTPSFTRLLGRLGVLRNKHIPDIYLRASISQRQALLQGLMDTDGWADRCQVSYCSTSERLAKDVFELIASLGYRPTLVEKPAYAHVNRQRIPCGIAYLVSFTTLDAVFRLERKRLTQQERLAHHDGRRTGLRYIVDVLPVPSRPVRCIAVDSPSRLYLAGEAMIPTHNSLAYLLPAAVFALRNNQRVVVSTNTINLQEQIVGKDIPAMRALLDAAGPEDVRDALSGLRTTPLKGRRNYLCLQRFAAMRRAGPQDDTEARFLVRLLIWLAQTETGDRAELTLRPEEEPLWTRVSAQNSACFAGPSQFVRNGTCQLLRARRRAEAAHLVVVNHALLLSDLAAGGTAMPKYDYLVVDEAHNLEDEATSQFGFQAGAGHIDEYLNSLWLTTPREAGLVEEIHTALRGPAEGAAPPLHIAADAVREAVEHARERVPEVFGRVAAFVRNHAEGNGDYDNRLLLTPAKRAQPEWEQVEIAWDNLRLPLLDLQGALANLHASLAGADSAEILNYDTLLSSVAAQAQAGMMMRKGIEEIVEQHDGDRIAWITTNRATGLVSFSSAPLDVGSVLDNYLFSQKAGVVLTSATLSTSGHFEYVKQRLGIQDPDELLLDSPFDYKRAALVLVPSDMPEPSQPAYQKAVEEALVGLCAASKGRALVLFTSHAALRATARATRRPLERQGVRVLAQGMDGTPAELLEQLKARSGTVIFGTSSFWEGVDVVGDALSLLVIAKLPFSVPTDPVFAARSALFDEPFREYALPQAVLRFKQGFGRLIRHKTDRGAVVVLDRRLRSKGYGRMFLESLPPCSVSEAPAAQLPSIVARWLAAGPS